MAWHTATPLSGMQIKDWRIDLDLTQRALSALLGLDTTLVARWEHGGSQRHPKLIALALEALEVRRVLGTLVIPPHARPLPTPADERWRPIPGWEDYAVSDAGRVKRVTPTLTGLSAAGNRVLAAWIAPNGYRCIRLSDGSRSQSLGVPRLVLAAWDRAPEDGEEVDHADRNPTNDALGNLRWLPTRVNRLLRDQRLEVARQPDPSKRFVRRIDWDHAHLLETAVVEQHDEWEIFPTGQDGK